MNALQSPHPVWRRVQLNTLWLILARVVPQGINFAFVILIGRTLGGAALGLFTWITAIVYLANVWITFGLDTYLIRELASDESGEPGRHFSTVVQLQLILVFLTLMGFAGAVALMPIRSGSTLLVFSLSLLPMAFTTAYSAAFRAYEQMNLIFALQGTAAAVQLLVGILLITIGQPIETILFTLVAIRLGEAILAALLFQNAFRGVSLLHPSSLQTLRTVALSAVPLALLMLTSVSYQRLGVFITAALGTDLETGLFSAAIRLVEAAKLIPYALYGALFPVLVKQSADPERLRSLFRGLVGIGVLGTLILAATAPWLIGLLFGPSFSASVGVLQISAWSLIPFLFSLKFSVELVTAGHERAAYRAALVALVATAAIGLLGYRHFGLMGLSLALVLGETIHALSLWLPHRRLA